MISSFIGRYRTECIIFSTAFLLRFLFFVTVVFFPFWAPSEKLSLIPILGSDSVDYLSATRGLLETGRFLNQLGEPNSYELPGYPLFLAAIIAWFGTLLAVSLIQNLITGLSAVLLYRIGLVISKRAALGAVLLFALDPTGIFFSNTILTEPLFIFFVLLSFWCMVHYLPRFRYAFIAGVTLGIATMIRPVGEVFLPAAMLFYPLAQGVRWRNGIKAGILFLVGFVVIVSPWLIRNKILFDQWDLSVAASMQFVYSHAPLFYAYKNNVPPREAVMIFQERLIEISPFKEEIRKGKAGNLRNAPFMRQVAFDYIKQYPGEYAVFHIIKTAPFFISDGLREIGQRLDLIKRPLPNLGDLLLKQDFTGFRRAVSENTGIFAAFLIGSFFWLAINLFMGIGFLSSFFSDPKKKAVLVSAFLFVIVMALAAGGAVAHPRYRFSVSPFMFLLASYGFFAALDKIKERR